MGIRILIPRWRRRQGGKPLRFLWLCVGLALWALAYTLFGAEGLAGVMRARQGAAELEVRIERTRANNRRLRQRIDALRNDPATIEREARERLFLARPGETVYLLPTPTPSPPPDSGTAARDDDPSATSPPPDDASQR